MNYKDLKIYQLADELRSELYKELIKIPDFWKIKEVRQTIDSSSSAATNIAEGHGRQRHPKDHIRFLEYSLTSSDETQDHSKALFALRLISKDKSEYFVKKYTTLSIWTLRFTNSVRKKHNL